ncbi:MAG TPA: hypothetical protein VGS06_39210 [Streptosporangiaceae bacterium]|nr:hypothetical protein [Streptosporangiaceae bacterium]
MTGSARPDFVLDGPDELARLRQFRAGHPDVLIGDGGFGTWQALIPEPDGETVVTRHTLHELLDRLAMIFPGLEGPRGAAVQLCRDGGADPKAIPEGIAEGRRRRDAARQPPFSGDVR